METFSALLAICAGNSPVPGEFPTQRPVTRSFDVYFDLRPNERLSKQSWGWWFETLSRSLWRHRNAILDTLASGLELRRIPLPLVPRGDGTTEVTSHTHCHGIGIIRRRVFTLWSGNWGFGRWFLKSKHLQRYVRKRLKVSAGKLNSLVVKTGASCLMAIVIIAVLYLIILSMSMQLSWRSGTVIWNLSVLNLKWVALNKTEWPACSHSIGHPSNKLFLSWNRVNIQ